MVKKYEFKYKLNKTIFLIFTIFSFLISFLNSATTKQTFTDITKQQAITSTIPISLAITILAPIVHVIYPKINTKYLLQTKEINDDLTAAQKKRIGDVIRQMGLDPSKIKLYSTEDYAAFVIDNHTMVVGKPMLEDPDKEKFRNIIGHECGHIIHNDVFNEDFALAAVAASLLATADIGKIIFDYVRGGKTNNSLLSYIIELVIKACIGVIIAAPILAKYSRFMEKRADKEALKKLKTYKGNIEHFSKSAQRMKAYQDYIETLPLSARLKTKLINYFRYNLLASHPAPQERVQAAIKRALKDMRLNNQIVLPK